MSLSKMPGSKLERTSSTEPMRKYASQKLGYEVAHPRKVSDAPRRRKHTIKYSKIKHLPTIREEGGRRRRTRRRVR